MKFKPFRCVECGASVQETAGFARTREYRRGVAVQVPDDRLIPTCTGCGEIYLTVEESAELDVVLKPIYLAWQKTYVSEIIGRLKSTHAVTLRQIEGACAVTATYLSHVIAGRKEASATLLNLLEAYVAAPSEFARHLAGGARSIVPVVHHNEYRVSKRVGLSTVQWSASSPESLGIISVFQSPTKAYVNSESKGPLAANEDLAA